MRIHEYAVLTSYFLHLLDIDEGVLEVVDHKLEEIIAENGDGEQKGLVAGKAVYLVNNRLGKDDEEWCPCGDGEEECKMDIEREPAEDLKEEARPAGGEREGEGDIKDENKSVRNNLTSENLVSRPGLEETRDTATQDQHSEEEEETSESEYITAKKKNDNDNDGYSDEEASRDTDEYEEVETHEPNPSLVASKAMLGLTDEEVFGLIEYLQDGQTLAEQLAKMRRRREDIKLEVYGTYIRNKVCETRKVAAKQNELEYDILPQSDNEKDTEERMAAKQASMWQQENDATELSKLGKPLPSPFKVQTITQIHRGAVHAVDVDVNRRLILTGSDDGTVKLFHLDNGVFASLALSPPDHLRDNVVVDESGETWSEFVVDCCFVGDTGVIAAVTGQGTLHLLRIKDESGLCEELGNFKNLLDDEEVIELHSAGKHKARCSPCLFVVGAERTICLLRLDPFLSLPNGAKPIEKIADLKTHCFIHFTCPIHLRPTTIVLREHTEGSRRMALVQACIVDTGKIIYAATASYDGVVRVFDLTNLIYTSRPWDANTTLEPALNLHFGSPVHSVAFSPDSYLLAAGGQASRIAIYPITRTTKGLEKMEGSWSVNVPPELLTSGGGVEVKQLSFAITGRYLMAFVATEWHNSTHDTPESIGPISIHRAFQRSVAVMFDTLTPAPLLYTIAPDPSPILALTPVGFSFPDAPHDTSGAANSIPITSGFFFSNPSCTGLLVAGSGQLILPVETRPSLCITEVAPIPPFLPSKRNEKRKPSPISVVAVTDCGKLLLIGPDQVPESPPFFQIEIDPDVKVGEHPECCVNTPLGGPGCPYVRFFRPPPSPPPRILLNTIPPHLIPGRTLGHLWGPNEEELERGDLSGAQAFVELVTTIGPDQQTTQDEDNDLRQLPTDSSSTSSEQEEWTSSEPIDSDDIGTPPRSPSSPSSPSPPPLLSSSSSSSTSLQSSDDATEDSPYSEDKGLKTRRMATRQRRPTSLRATRATRTTRITRSTRATRATRATKVTRTAKATKTTRVSRSLKNTTRRRQQQQRQRAPPSESTTSEEVPIESEGSSDKWEEEEEEQSEENTKDEENMAKEESSSSETPKIPKQVVRKNLSQQKKEQETPAIATVRVNRRVNNRERAWWLERVEAGTEDVTRLSSILNPPFCTIVPQQGDIAVIVGWERKAVMDLLFSLSRQIDEEQPMLNGVVGDVMCPVYVDRIESSRYVRIPHFPIAPKYSSLEGARERSRSIGKGSGLGFIGRTGSGTGGGVAVLVTLHVHMLAVSSAAESFGLSGAELAYMLSRLTPWNLDAKTITPEAIDERNIKGLGDLGAVGGGLIDILLTSDMTASATPSLPVGCGLVQLQTILGIGEEYTSVGEELYRRDIMAMGSWAVGSQATTFCRSVAERFVCKNPFQVSLRNGTVPLDNALENDPELARLLSLAQAANKAAFSHPVSDIGDEDGEGDKDGSRDDDEDDDSEPEVEHWGAPRQRRMASLSTRASLDDEGSLQPLFSLFDSVLNCILGSEPPPAMWYCGRPLTLAGMLSQYVSNSSLQHIKNTYKPSTLHNCIVVGRTAASKLQTAVLGAFHRYGNTKANTTIHQTRTGSLTLPAIPTPGSSIPLTPWAATPRSVAQQRLSQAVGASGKHTPQQIFNDTAGSMSLASRHRFVSVLVYVAVKHRDVSGIYLENPTRGRGAIQGYSANCPIHISISLLVAKLVCGVYRSLDGLLGDIALFSKNAVALDFDPLVIQCARAFADYLTGLLIHAAQW